MNVTIVMGPWLPVPPVRGGAMPKVWHGLAREFVRRGHRVAIVARREPGQAAEESDGALRIVRARGFAQSSSVMRDLAKDLAYAVDLLPRLPSADVVVCNDFWVPALTSRLRPSAGATIVCAARFPKGQYRLYSRVARIVAISSAVRTAIVAERPALAARTVVIPLPVDVDALEERSDPEQSSRKTVLYVGRVHPEKGVELLLRAFALTSKRCPAWRLRIVGPVAEADGGGGERFAQAMRDLARGLDVEFPGPVFDPARLRTEFQRADLFCYPSLAAWGEAFGLAPLEAMACGVPPVVSQLECFRDFLRDGENGWTFDHRGPDAPSRLADTLAEAMRDSGARARAGRRARDDARQFTYGAIAERYLDEFERTLGRPS